MSHSVKANDELQRREAHEQKACSLWETRKTSMNFLEEFYANSLNFPTQRKDIPILDRHQKRQDQEINNPSYYIIDIILNVQRRLLKGAGEINQIIKS